MVSFHLQQEGHADEKRKSRVTSDDGVPEVIDQIDRQNVREHGQEVLHGKLLQHGLVILGHKPAEVGRVVAQQLTEYRIVLVHLDVRVRPAKRVQILLKEGFIAAKSQRLIVKIEPDEGGGHRVQALPVRVLLVRDQEGLDDPLQLRLAVGTR